MTELSSSLVALAILALRNGKPKDSAQLLVQAAYLPETEQLLESLIGNNVAAEVLTYSAMNSYSNTCGDLHSLADSFASELTSVSSDTHGMYAGDEFVPMSMSSDDDDDEDEDEDGIDLGFVEEDEDDEDDEPKKKGKKSVSSHSGVTITLN